VTDGVTDDKTDRKTPSNNTVTTIHSIA